MPNVRSRHGWEGGQGRKPCHHAERRSRQGDVGDWVATMKAKGNSWHGALLQMGRREGDAHVWRQGRLGY